jgi:hypothetical protein
MQDEQEPGTAEEASLVTTWKDVEGLIKAHAFPKWAGRVIGVVCIVLAIVCGFVAKGYFDQRDASSQLRAQNHTLLVQAAQAQAQRNQLKAYVDEKVRNECAALNLLTARPVPKPADPAANPSRQTNYEFYTALKFWATSDGCVK